MARGKNLKFLKQSRGVLDNNQEVMLYSVLPLHPLGIANAEGNWCSQVPGMLSTDTEGVKTSV